jgi:hypothetical protein
LAACGNGATAGGGACETYLACLQDVVNQSGAAGAAYQTTLDQAKSQYASGGACSSSDTARKACNDACNQGLSSAHQAFASVASCGAATTAVPTSGGASLSVRSTNVLFSANGRKSAHGEFIIAGITLQNTGSSTPLSASPMLFSLSFPNGTQVSATSIGSGSDVGDECDDKLSVVSGGSVSCSLAFDVSASDAPTSIVYTSSGTMTTASIVLPSAPTIPDTLLWGSISEAQKSYLCSSIMPKLPPNGECVDTKVKLLANAAAACTTMNVWPLTKSWASGLGCTGAQVHGSCTVGQIKQCIAAVNADACMTDYDSNCKNCLDWLISDQNC